MVGAHNSDHGAFGHIQSISATIDVRLFTATVFTPQGTSLDFADKNASRRFNDVSSLMDEQAAFPDDKLDWNQAKYFWLVGIGSLLLIQLACCAVNWIFVSVMDSLGWAGTNVPDWLIFGILATIYIPPFVSGGVLIAVVMFGHLSILKRCGLGVVLLSIVTVAYIAFFISLEGVMDRDAAATVVAILASGFASALVVGLIGHLTCSWNIAPTIPPSDKAHRLGIQSMMQITGIIAILIAIIQVSIDTSVFGILPMLFAIMAVTILAMGIGILSCACFLRRERSSRRARTVYSVIMTFLSLGIGVSIAASIYGWTSYIELTLVALPATAYAFAVASATVWCCTTLLRKSGWRFTRRNEKKRDHSDQGFRVQEASADLPALH